MTRLVFSWNIKPDAETAYFEFVVQEFAPKLVKLGIRPTEAWYTVCMVKGRRSSCRPSSPTKSHSLKS